MSFASRETSRTLGERVHLFTARGADPTLESMVTSIAVGPGLGEFVLGTTRVNRDGQPSNWRPGMVTFLQRSLRDLRNVAPHVSEVTLTVCWHVADLRLQNVNIRPRSGSDKEGSAYNWRVGSVDRGSSIRATGSGDGAPGDRSVMEAITYLKSLGYKVTLCPRIFVDIPADNDKPDPWGAKKTDPYPWRGRITCDPAPGEPGTPDKSSAIGALVDRFFGTVTPAHFSWTSAGQRIAYTGPADEWSYRRFILHYATLGDRAGVDGFVIGSCLRGVTTLRNGSNGFPAVSKLVALAADVDSIFDPWVKIGYEADWTEYHSYRPRDGSGDVFFHLDPLWASNSIAFVGINWTAPLADWRDGDLHRDRKMGWGSPYDWDYLQHNIEGGEGYEWRYAGPAARKNQHRVTIEDPLGEPWVYRDKDVRGWWNHRHFNRPGGARAASPTSWVPGSKPVRFLVSYLPLDKAVNGARDEEAPPFTDGRQDEIAQRAGVEAFLDYWKRRGGQMVEQVTPWFWDARPSPPYPNEAAEDEYNRSTTLTGRLQPGQSFTGEPIPTFGFTSAEQPITRNGVVHEPVAIGSHRTVDNGSLDKSTLTLTLAQGTPLDDLFRIYPPMKGVNLTIREGHVGEDPDDPLCFPVAWSGNILSAEFGPNDISLECRSVQAAMLRSGLRVRWQIGCPHALYGPRCRANRARATVQATAASVTTTTFTLAAPLPLSPDPTKYVAGIAQWAVGGGHEMRTIVEVIDRRTVRVRGLIRGLAPGETVSLSLGCNHRTTDCKNLHDNILNYGGCPAIPIENPFGRKNQYY